MTAKIMPDAGETFRALSDHLSFLQVKGETLSNILARVSRKTSQSARESIEDSSRTSAKLCRRFKDLHSFIRRRPSVGVGGPRLSLEAMILLLAVCEQCDEMIDLINSTTSAVEIERCTTYLRAVSYSAAVALQCLKHAQFLDELPDMINLDQKDQCHRSRVRLQRYVTEQQFSILAWLIDDSNSALEKKQSLLGPMRSRSDLKKESLMALLHPSLLRSEQRMYARITETQIDDIVEDFSQKLLFRWVTRTDLNSSRPVVFPHPAPPVQPVLPAQPMPVPRQNRSPATLLRPILRGSPPLTRIDTSAANLTTRPRRYSMSAAPSTIARATSAPQQGYSATSSFQPSSFPPSSLKDPPFVVTHARAQARLNASPQPLLQAQPVTRRASSASSSSASYPQPYHHYPRRNSHAREESSAIINSDNTCPASPVSDISSLSPTTNLSHETISWRLNALGQHWDFDNEQLVHNTGSVPPSAARTDRNATTEIRKSLLTPAALQEMLGGGIGSEHMAARWQIIERKVVNADKSQMKKFVSVQMAMGWREVEALVRRSGELYRR